MRWIGRLAVLLVLGGAAAAFWHFYARGAAVVVHVIGRGSAAEIVYGTGAVEPVDWAKVISPVRARIEMHCRCEGKTVKAGDILARLDEKTPLAELAQLNARRDFLAHELHRQTELQARGTVSRQTFERTQSDLGQVEAQMAAAKARLGDYKLTAPIDGVVLRADGQIGEIVGTTEPLFWVGKPKPLQVIADVNEEDIARVLEGQAVLLRNDAFPDRPLAASVGSITPKGDPARKTFRIYLKLPDETPLRIGMSVEANIVVREKADVLVVPAEAVVDNGVFVLDGNRVARRPVTIGIRGTRHVEIAGVAEGERVVSPVPSGLRDGQAVRAIDRPAK